MKSYPACGHPVHDSNLIAFRMAGDHGRFELHWCKKCAQRNAVLGVTSLTGGVNPMKVWYK